MNHGNVAHEANLRVFGKRRPLSFTGSVTISPRRPDNHQNGFPECLPYRSIWSATDWSAYAARGTNHRQNITDGAIEPRGALPITNVGDVPVLGTRLPSRGGGAGHLDDIRLSTGTRHRPIPLVEPACFRDLVGICIRMPCRWASSAKAVTTPARFHRSGKSQSHLF